MANRTSSQDPFPASWQPVTTLFQAVARYDQLAIAILVPLSLTPIASAWAVNAMFDKEEAWYHAYADFLATFSYGSAICGAFVLAFALQATIVSKILRLERYRVLRWIALALSAFVSLTYQIGLADYRQSRAAGVAQITREGESVVIALEDFHRQYGRYPARLDELVPSYFSQEPSPGLVGYRRFEYFSAKGGYTLSVPLLYWPRLLEGCQVAYRTRTEIGIPEESKAYSQWVVEGATSSFSTPLDPKR